MPVAAYCTTLLLAWQEDELLPPAMPLMTGYDFWTRTRLPPPPPPASSLECASWCDPVWPVQHCGDERCRTCDFCTARVGCIADFCRPNAAESHCLKGECMPCAFCASVCPRWCELRYAEAHCALEAGPTRPLGCNKCDFCIARAAEKARIPASPSAANGGVDSLAILTGGLGPSHGAVPEAAPAPGCAGWCRERSADFHCKEAASCGGCDFCRSIAAADVQPRDGSMPGPATPLPSTLSRSTGNDDSQSASPVPSSPSAHHRSSRAPPLPPPSPPPPPPPPPRRVCENWCRERNADVHCQPKTPQCLSCEFCREYWEREATLRPPPLPSQLSVAREPAHMLPTASGAPSAVSPPSTCDRWCRERSADFHCLELSCAACDFCRSRDRVDMPSTTPLFSPSLERHALPPSRPPSPRPTLSVLLPHALPHSIARPPPPPSSRQTATHLREGHRAPSPSHMAPVPHALNAGIPPVPVQSQGQATNAHVTLMDDGVLDGTKSGVGMSDTMSTAVRTAAPPHAASDATSAGTALAGAPEETLAASQEALLGPAPMLVAGGGALATFIMLLALSWYCMHRCAPRCAGMAAAKAGYLQPATEEDADELEMDGAHGQ